jgi:hypothetical protein
VVVAEGPVPALTGENLRMTLVDGYLAATVDLLGAEGLQARAAQVRRLLEDDGATYGLTAKAGGAPGRWCCAASRWLPVAGFG